MKKRIVIIGSSGIISQNLQKKLKEKKLKFVTFGRKDINLKTNKSPKILNKKIKNNDIIIFISAETPAKNMKMFFNNIKICDNVCKALEEKKINKLIYISSDAVYSDTPKKINEKSKTVPDSIHGMMHLMREINLQINFKKKLCILRPTLIYGFGDTHQGYGPNRFINLARKNKDIFLFGKGEERRDHLYIDDLINILFKCIKTNKFGIYNLASGTVNSFNKIAKIAVTLTKSKSKIFNTKRAGLMPHNGYRPFNVAFINKNFQNIELNTIENGIKKYLREFN
jgi:nucleoside-diphosphate-sugar epimerase|tara:strand:- start:776 stop:1624 length:849 start_codon:yes stop_codon:yes gene_type:complete